MVNSNLNAIRIYLLVVPLLLYGVRRISGTIFGLESPIEVIEEWGCRDLPVRLTCPRLDSKIVILEATFTPNCTDNKKNSNCHAFDSNGRLTRVFLKHSRHDYRLQETEAGRRFLQTLRKSHEDYVERLSEEEGGNDDNNNNDDDHEGNNNEGELENGPFSTTFSSSSSPNLLRGSSSGEQQQQKVDETVLLKSSLERMIVEYLKKLSPEEDFESEEFLRLRRHLMEIVVEPTAADDFNQVDDGDEVEEEGASSDDVGGLGVLNSSNEVTENVLLTFNNGSQSEFVSSDENAASAGGVPKGRKHKGAGKKCVHSRRVVSSLSAADLERAHQNETENEYNIRRIINYRCSGKNHCNFIFAQDHPFSLIWSAGIVRIKYACMNDFRITKYCGEILAIGNERGVALDEEEEEADDGVDGLRRGKNGPVVAARMQLLKEQNFHQFTNLKIMKADDDSSPTAKPKRRKLAPPKKIEEQHQESKVYSQDFRTLKILPADTKDFNEIELIGEDLYFGNNVQDVDEFHVDNSVPTEDTLLDNYVLKGRTTSPDLEREIEKEIDDLIENDIVELHENLTKAHFDGDHSKRLGDQRSTSSSIREDQEDHLVNEKSSSTRVPAKEEVVNKGTLLLGAEEDDDEYSSRIAEDLEDDEDDDYYYDDDEYDIYNRNKGPKKYKSIARTQLRRPLLQGFLMSPGYPKFYIGEMECKYIIKAPRNHQIRITLFDISLRSELPCRDYLEIEDLIQRRSLYAGCAELSRPLSVVTGAHIARIKFKTTTKTAYPKRGILVHYMSVGCVQPELPRNVELLEFNSDEGYLKVQCKDPDSVFPDTSLPARVLFCSAKHVSWDRSLPSCIELEQLSGSGLVSHLNSDLFSSSSSISSGAAMNKPADVVIDVIVPCVIIGALFLVNGLIMVMILKRRSQSNPQNSPRELEDM